MENEKKEQKRQAISCYFSLFCEKEAYLKYFLKFKISVLTFMLLFMTNDIFPSPTIQVSIQKDFR